MKLLVIEDEPRILKYLVHGLQQQAHVVDTATDGLAGLDLALAEEYDVLIIDWMLPGLSGPQIITQLRSEKVSTPVLLLTAKDQLGDTVTGLDAGADDYLPKPFELAELLARIRALGRRQPQLQSQQLQCADLVLDPATRTVTRAGGQITLTKKEFSLLEYLLRHQGQVLSKQQIVERVWSFDDAVTENAVQVYIMYLRKKIDLAFLDRPPLIHTVRGIGYKLADKS